MTTSSAQATVKQVSTGPNTACAVVNGKVKCWGEGGAGQLGNRATSDSVTPVDVYAEKDPAPIRPSPCGGWFQPSCTPIPQPSSPLGGKTVSKVSVGKNHACAIASAKLYCWGDNAKGQLGNRTNTKSTMPVAVDMQDKDITPPPVKPNPCGGWFQPSCTAVPQPTIPKSGLGGKEIVDVAAAEDFTCALASDGTVACWGEGDDGRLGTNATTDINYPKAVYSATGSAFAGKKGIKLSQASATTMCVLAVESTSTEAISGKPYCWGKGIHGGQVIPANNSSAVVCSKSSPTANPSTTTKTTIFDSKQPTAVSDTAMASIDGQNYMTSLGADSRAYTWGMYGYQEVVTYANVKTCKVNPCTGKVVIEREDYDISLAGKVGEKKTTTKNGKTTNTSSYGRLNGRQTTTTKRNADGSTTTTTSYFKKNNNNGSGGNSCNAVVHYGFTKNVNYSEVGKKTAVVPTVWPQAQAGIKKQSGLAVDGGLYCAVITNNVLCDAHGGSSKLGQTGSGYTEKCTTKTVLVIFKETTCEPAPTGPQTVVSDGWLAGKTVSQLSTSPTGFTCAIANGSLGCWGVNSVGQLGVGDKVNRNVPTEVRL